MKKTFFTSDQHFSHGNIIKFCSRPFSCIEDMNETLIANHNAVVRPEDDVYHLGDFAFKNHAMYRRRLNGTHHLIKGNHEGNGWKEAGFKWVREVAMIKVEGESVFLSHYAHRVWNRSHYNVIHLYGHSHNSLAGYGKSMDVGVDCNNYYPFEFEEIKQILKNIDCIRHH